MNNITILEGTDLDRFLEMVGVPSGTWTGIRTLRINQRPDGVAYKINSGTWSPTVGRRDDQGRY